MHGGTISTRALVMARTAEQGHTKACLAAAVICAVENLRDDSESDITFRLDLQNNMPLVWADIYLEEGTATCICPNRPTLTVRP